MPEEITSLPEAPLAHEPVSPKVPRKRLRFLDTKGITAPNGFMYLDGCLDQLATKRLGARWDVIVGLRCFPFQYISKRRKFYRYSVSRERPYKRIDRQIVVRGRTQRKEFRSASREYKKLLKKLSNDIQAEAFKVSMISPDGEVTPVRHLGVFAAQVVRAFYTGTIRVKENDKRFKRWILVDEKSFTHWLENGDGPRHQPRGSAIFRPLLPAIAERAALKKYSLVKQAFGILLDEVKTAFEPHLELNDAAFRALWNDDSLAPVQRAKAGAPPKADRQAFQKDRAGLKAFLIDNIKKMQASKQL
ncbi:hypothetical protein NKK48_29165 [Mesorhizobium sp. C386A]|uniref:hypothetical protein n=1 Tax=unclassified Mesorhizobium TaxID=325217 RepID=UPI0003CE790C|nr:MULTISPECIES: hypothetical protein [unclassified Mesorhizobium]ESY09148.1 hypothetical protein X752_21055 [Mesorhizobium sp. LNJC398B00]ESY32055.1 hypothetical protein X748_24065 [Mesorhizobium sp. LNJC386A00]